MKKMNKKAFTLIELLIVIAIIGVLFVVLVSRVDFATDKAKATGVQTDFRAFQIAFEQVAKENAGFNTFGWDEGDTNGNRVRDSFDIGDVLCGDTDKNGELNGSEEKPATCKGGCGQDGKMADCEVWVGTKTYTEDWTGIYTLVNPADASDVTAIVALQDAINKNLDPKLQIVIDTTKMADRVFEITMANQAADPWKTEYKGYYLTDASAGSSTNSTIKSAATKGEDSLDRGAIIMYSFGANLADGTVEEIVDGEVVVTVKQSAETSGTKNVSDNNKAGADDYSVSTIYTYKNGYGEVVSNSTGFSNNQ